MTEVLEKLQPIFRVGAQFSPVRTEVREIPARLLVLGLLFSAFFLKA